MKPRAGHVVIFGLDGVELFNSAFDIFFDELPELMFVAIDETDGYDHRHGYDHHVGDTPDEMEIPVTARTAARTYVRPR